MLILMEEIGNKREKWLINLINITFQVFQDLKFVLKMIYIKIIILNNI
jgi:hypothetical protein